MKTLDFIKMINNQRIRFLKTYAISTIIDIVDNEMQQMKTLIANSVEVKNKLTRVEHDSYEEAWKPISELYKNVKEFTAGLSCIFPGTAAVESDFSIIGYEKNDYRSNLTDFSLEGILHCKQFNLLNDNQ